MSSACGATGSLEPSNALGDWADCATEPTGGPKIMERTTTRNPMRKLICRLRTRIKVIDDAKESLTANGIEIQAKTFHAGTEQNGAASQILKSVQRLCPLA